MLIVLEGCDGSGKTVIATHLKNILPGAEIVHCTEKTPNDYKFFQGIIDASKQRDIIADRFCYGQFVYQEPNERHLTEQDLISLEEEMLANSAKVIYVSASVDEIEDRLALRKEKTVIPVGEICDRYIDLFMNKSILNPYVWWTGRYD